MHFWGAALGALAAVAFAGMSCSQPASDAAPPAASGATTTTISESCVVPAGTVVSLELAEPVSSKSSKPGDQFALRLATPVVVNGATAVAAGAPGVGKVIDAQHPGMGGKPGKLVLAARYLDCGGARIPLQSLKIGVGTGKDYTDASMAVGIAVGVVGLAVQGGNIDYPVGFRATAKVAAVPPSSTAGDQAGADAIQQRPSN